MSTQGPEPSEEELRAAFEEQMRNITVDQVLIETAVTLVNLAGRKLGLGAGAEDQRDLAQVRDAIDAVRGLVPVLERQAGAPDMGPLRAALSQLQMEYAKLAGQPEQAQPAAPPTPPAPAAEPEKPGDPGAGPAQSSGRLWVPGS